LFTLLKLLMATCAPTVPAAGAVDVHAVVEILRTAIGVTIANLITVANLASAKQDEVTVTRVPPAVGSMLGLISATVTAK
jgi:hypothetical protein